MDSKLLIKIKIKKYKTKNVPVKINELLTWYKYKKCLYTDIQKSICGYEGSDDLKLQLMSSPSFNITTITTNMINVSTPNAVITPSLAAYGDTAVEQYFPS